MAPGTGWWFTQVTMGQRASDREADLKRREAEVAARAADLERREAEVAAREAALALRMPDAQGILVAADERDALADQRDAAADKRERDLDLAELLSPPEKPGYGDDWPQRRNAGMDRTLSKGDRAASHDDRLALTEGNAGDKTDET